MEAKLTLELKVPESAKSVSVSLGDWLATNPVTIPERPG